MYRPFTQIVIVFVSLLTLVGQSWASTAMVCQHMSQDSGQHSAMNHSDMAQRNMQHQSMQHQAMEHSMSADLKTLHHAHGSHDPVMADDCCGAECACPVSACSAPTFVFSPFSLRTENQSPVMIRQLANHPQTRPTPLFRPPILA